MLSDRSAAPRAYQNVANGIASSIVEGRLAKGTRLPSERELMDAFGVGRSAVREALLLLHSRGFVNIVNGARATVAMPSVPQIVDDLGLAAQLLLMQPTGQRTFQSARSMIEVGLARNAAINATPVQIRDLHGILEENFACRDDLARFAEIDMAFHLKIAEISGNELIISLHSALVGWLKKQREVSGRAPDAVELALRSHEEIYRAILAADPEAAQDAMQRHLDCVARRYWRMIDDPHLEGGR